MRVSWGEGSLVEPKLPLHVFNPHEGMGNNANNMPPTNRPGLPIKSRQQHLAAVAVQAGKKKSLSKEQLASCALSVDTQTPPLDGLIP